MFRSAVLATGCCLASGMSFGDRLESKGSPTALRPSDLSMGDVCVVSGGKRYCELDGTLKRNSSKVTSGSDNLGAFTMNTTKWSPVDFETAVVTYDEGTYIFRQRFPNGLNGTTLGHNSTTKNSISSQYPSFLVKGGPYKGYLQYKGAMLGMNYEIGSTVSDISPMAGGAENSGPLVLFDHASDSSAVISSASNFMSHSQQVVQNESVVGFGLMGDISSVPAGYELDTIVSYTSYSSPKKAMYEWGNRLLKKYGKSRDTYLSDLTVNNLGYSTDNGAWYYYYTEEGKNYQQTMKDVKKYSESAGLPYKYWLMDSWWYFKSDGGAVKNWTAMPSIFPDGIANVTAATHWPIVAHNRYWAGDTDYAKQNGGQYNFIVEDKHSIPNDQTFWDDLIGNATAWGLHTYEQDWLFNEYEDLNCTLDSPTLARDWLLQMGRAAQKHQKTIQYCMSWPRHIMQSIEIQQVTQARASGDYQPGHDNWQPIGVTSLFAESVSLRATKDNFWTTDKEFSSKRYGGQKERYNRLHAAVSTFSMGPVAPSDEIGMTDVPLVMRSCSKSGLLLKPDEPAILMDSVFHTVSEQIDGPTGSIWSTGATVSGIKTYYLLAAQSTPYKMAKSELCADAVIDEFVAWESNSTKTAQKFDDSNPISLPQTDKWDFNLWTVAPILTNGWVVMGEAATKWVSVSNQRFNMMVVEKDSVTIEVVGQPGEEIEVLFLQPSKSMNSIPVKCTFSSEKLMITMPGAMCH